MSMRLIDMYLVGMHLIGEYLIGVNLMRGSHAWISCVDLIGIHLMGRASPQGNCG
jgi:hypothetical protein